MIINLTTGLMGAARVSQHIDWAILNEHYYVSSVRKQEVLLTVGGEQLLQREHARAFLELYGKGIKAEVLDAACTYFASWISGLCAAKQAALSYYEQSLDTRLSNLTVQLYASESGKPHIQFVLDHAEAKTCSAGRNREEWVAGELADFYQGAIRPLFESLAEAADVHSTLMWSLLPSGVYYRHDELLKRLQTSAPEAAARLEKDYHILSKELSGDVFGTRRNPFNIEFRTIPSWKDPSVTLRQKSGCCLYYRTEGGTYCYTCPRMTDEQRELRKQELLRQNA